MPRAVILTRTASCRHHTMQACRGRTNGNKDQCVQQIIEYIEQGDVTWATAGIMLYQTVENELYNLL